MNGQSAAALADLLHADHVLLDLYESAMGSLSAETTQMLSEAIHDHRVHESELLEAIETADLQLSEPSDDVRLLMEEHVMKIARATEEHEVLETLMLAERLNSMLYETAERENMPEELSDVIADHHADERMHASLIAERMPEVSSMGSHAVSCMTGGMTDDINPDDFD